MIFFRQNGCEGPTHGGFKMDHDFRTVRKVLRGNIECFEELILKYESRVYRTCWRFVGNSNDAEDITGGL